MVQIKTLINFNINIAMFLITFIDFVVLGKKGLLPDPLVGKWIANVAKQEANKK